MKKYIKLNNVLGLYALLSFVANLFGGDFDITSLLGSLYYLVAAIFLFKNSKIGYVLIIISILGLGISYGINFYLNSY